MKIGYVTRTRTQTHTHRCHFPFCVYLFLLRIFARYSMFSPSIAFDVQFFAYAFDQHALRGWYGNEMGNIKTKYTSHFISFHFCCYALCARVLTCLYSVHCTCQMYWRSKPWFVCVRASILFDCFRSARKQKPLTCFTNYKIGNPSHSFLAAFGICTLQITHLCNFSFHRGNGHFWPCLATIFSQCNEVMFHL